MYGWLLMLVAEKFYGLTDPEFKANMLLVSSIPDHKSGVYTCDKKEIMRGFKEFSQLIKYIAYHTWENNI